MTVIVNGEQRQVDEDATVATVVESVTREASGVAVALNGTVVSRGDWESTPVGDSDRIEVLSAVQGG